MFNFIVTIAKRCSITNGDYRMRAKILIPYIKSTFPLQETSTRKNNSNISVVDTWCNFSDCLRNLLGEKLWAFNFKFSSCTQGHQEYQEKRATQTVMSETFGNPQKFYNFLKRIQAEPVEVGCSSYTNEGKECSNGRRTRSLISTGKIVISRTKLELIQQLLSHSP